MKAHFVRFYSPGTLFAETTEKPIDSWNVEEAIKMSKDIVERHGAIPYGFRFTTRGREENELDSREVERSPMYYLGGKVETLEEIKAKNDPDDRILISNMECNGYNRVVTTTNGYRWTQPLSDDDVVLTSTYCAGETGEP